MKVGLAGQAGKMVEAAEQVGMLAESAEDFGMQVGAG